MNNFYNQIISNEYFSNYSIINLWLGVYVTYCLGNMLDKATAAKHFEVYTYICGFSGIECTYSMHHLIYLQCYTVCMVKVQRRCAELDKASIEESISYNRHDIQICSYRSFIEFEHLEIH